MNKRKDRANAFRSNLKIWLVVSQVLGFVGAFVLGAYLDSGVEGFFLGYGLGVFLSLGGAFGLS